MQVDAFPLDYSIKPTTQREAWYRGFLREIKQQLDDAGVPTREVFFTGEQKRAYMNNPENLKRERERNPEAAYPQYPGRMLSAAIVLPSWHYKGVNEHEEI